MVIRALHRAAKQVKAGIPQFFVRMKLAINGEANQTIGGS